MTDPIQHLRDLMAKATPGECIIWGGPKNAAGYGLIYHNGRHTTTSRVVLQLREGRSLSSQEYACHKCDTPSCVNPHHLFIGTPTENVHDMMHKGRGNFTKTPEHREKLSRSVAMSAKVAAARRSGTACTYARFTERQISDIRNDTRSQRVIAEHYGCSQTLIGQIKRREVWKGVQ